MNWNPFRKPGRVVDLDAAKSDKRDAEDEAQGRAVRRYREVRAMLEQVEAYCGKSWNVEYHVKHVHQEVLAAFERRMR
jgi:hypothetical protein